MHPETLKQLKPKTKNLKFWQFGPTSRVPGAPIWVPTSKNIIYIISYSKYKYILKIWSFYDHRQKNAILTILGPSMAPNGQSNQNFGPITFLGMVRWVYTERLRIIAQKLKEKFYFPILGHFGPFGAIAQKRGPKSNFRSNNSFWHKKVSIIWAYENPSSKAEGGVLFLDFGPFWARFGP